MKNTKKLFALVVVIAMVLTSVFALVACSQHECTSQCPECDKCTNEDCKEEACKEKCEGHENPTPPSSDDPTPLAKPVLTLNDNVVSWTVVAHADNYSVSVNDGEATTTTSTSYTVTATAPGSYVVKVVAKSGSDKYLDSEAATITYTIAQPTGLVVTAQSDCVAVNYNDGWTIDWTSFDFSSYIVATVGNQSVDYADLTIVAAGDTYGEEALTLTISYGEEESAEVKFDVYYGIADLAQFRLIANDLAGWYMLTEDIEVATWMAPMGVFTGCLNGNYKKIIDYKIGDREPYDDNKKAMFEGNSGVIKNLNIQGGRVYGCGGGHTVGFVSGWNNGTIQNCFVRVEFVGASNHGAGITWGDDGTETTSGNVIGCVAVTEVYTEENGCNAVYGIVGYLPAGSAKDNLFIRVACPGEGHNHANGTRADKAIDYVANAINNAAIDADKLVFADDYSTFWSSDDADTVYENNFTSEILELVKEYLQQITAA